MTAEDLLITIKARLKIAGLLTQDYLLDYNYRTNSEILMPVSVEEAMQLVKHYMGASVKFEFTSTIVPNAKSNPVRAQCFVPGPSTDHELYFTSDDLAFAIIGGCNLCYRNAWDKYSPIIHKLLYKNN